MPFIGRAKNYMSSILFLFCRIKFLRHDVLLPKISNFFTYPTCMLASCIVWKEIVIVAAIHHCADTPLFHIAGAMGFDSGLLGLSQGREEESPDVSEPGFDPGMRKTRRRQGGGETSPRAFNTGKGRRSTRCVTFRRSRPVLRAATSGRRRDVAAETQKTQGGGESLLIRYQL